MIVWTPDLSLEIKEIDDQHKIFVSIINELQAAHDSRASRSALGPVLVKLFGYAHYHFSVEEKYFALFGYEGAPAHMADHKFFIDRVVDLRRRFEQNDENVAAETSEFLFDWLVNHIKVMDREYVTCFRDHGVRA